jgi:hypothetical protein
LTVLTNGNNLNSEGTSLRGGDTVLLVAEQPLSQYAIAKRLQESIPGLPWKSAERWAPRYFPTPEDRTPEKVDEWFRVMLPGVRESWETRTGRKGSSDE